MLEYIGRFMFNSLRNSTRDVVHAMKEIQKLADKLAKLKERKK